MTLQGSLVIGVAEIVLNVKDIERMSKFYQDVLGFAFHSESCTTSEGERGSEAKPTIVFLTIIDPGTPLSSGNHPQMLALIDPERHALARHQFEACLATRVPPGFSLIVGCSLRKAVKQV